MEKLDLQTGGTVTKEVPFWGGVEVILEATDLNVLYDTWSSKILESIDTFQNSGSGWTFKSIISLEVHTVRYQPLSGSSHIPLPKELANKKAIINLKNDDNQCFKWAVTRAVNPVDKNAEQIDRNLRAKAEALNWDGISFPTQLKDIDKFERNNPTISVNVHGYEKDVYPLRTSAVKREHEVDLLLLSGKCEDDSASYHYCVIKSLSRLLHGQKSKGKVKHFYCRRCYYSCITQERLAKHEDLCQSHGTVKIEMPERTEDHIPTQYFKNHFRSQSVPFVVYADSECFTRFCQPATPQNTTKYQKHEPSGFCYYIKCFDDSVYTQAPVIYTKKSEEEDLSQIFVSTLEKNIGAIYQKFKFPKEMIFKAYDSGTFKRSTHCHICKKPLTPDSKTNNTVRDHCHFTGKFRGAAHNSCNIGNQSFSP